MNRQILVKNLDVFPQTQTFSYESYDNFKK